MLLLTLTLILTLTLTLTLALTLSINPNTNLNPLPVHRSGPQSAFYQQPVSLNTAPAAPTAPAAETVCKRLPTPPKQSRNSYDWRPPPHVNLSFKFFWLAHNVVVIFLSLIVGFFASQ